MKTIRAKTPPSIQYTGEIAVCWSDRQQAKRGSSRCHIQETGLRDRRINSSRWKYPHTLCGILVDDEAGGWSYDVYEPELHDTISCRRCRAVWHRIHREKAEADFAR